MTVAVRDHGSLSIEFGELFQRDFDGLHEKLRRRVATVFQMKFGTFPQLTSARQNGDWRSQWKATL